MNVPWVHTTVSRSATTLRGASIVPAEMDSFFLMMKLHVQVIWLWTIVKKHEQCTYPVHAIANCLFSDIDECTLGYHNCEHNCRNTPGGFLCSCQDGFYLDADQYSCQGKCQMPLLVLIKVSFHKVNIGGSVDPDLYTNRCTKSCWAVSPTFREALHFSESARSCVCEPRHAQ